MISYIAKLLKSLNTNSHPGEIAHAVAIGVLLGFMPKDNALWYLLFVFFLCTYEQRRLSAYGTHCKFACSVF